MPMDYATLRIIWWLLLGVLLTGFAVMDGFDLGVAILYPFVPRTETQRRVLLNAIGPVWEGNQVWLILGGGAVFAAWPLLYAASFSGFYLAMMLALLGLILRPVALTFRGKFDSPTWRASWDWTFFVSGFVPSLIFGVAFGNLFVGTPFRFDSALGMEYQGDLFGLLNPFSLLCGLTSVFMLAMQGATFLASKSEGDVSRRAGNYGSLAAAMLIALLTIAGIWLAIGVDGFRVNGEIIKDGPSNPLLKVVARSRGAWLANYQQMPASFLAPALAYSGALGAAFFLRKGTAKLAVAFSSVSIAGVIFTAGCSLFPFLLPSSLNPDQSLTVWDASSSKTTLGLMLVVALIFLPIVLAYTSWVFHVLRGPVTEAAIECDEDYHY